MPALGPVRWGTREGSRGPMCYIFLIFRERPYLSVIEYDTRLNKTHNKRCVSISAVIMEAFLEVVDLSWAHRKKTKAVQGQS